jgi:hypothetical protein
VTVYTRRLLIVIPAAQRAAANAAAKVVDPEGGERAFTVGLNTSGRDADAISHYWCSWQMTPAQETQLRAEFQARGVTPSREPRVSDFDPQVARPRPDEVQTELNVRPRESTPRTR